MRSADHDSANWLLPWRQPESTRGYVPLMWHVALCSGLATPSLYVPCRSVCDRDQNWIKWSKPFWGADQGIKMTSKLLKVNNQGHAAAMWPLTLENQAIKSFRREWSSDQAHFLPIKELDHSCQHFYRRHISDYPLVSCDLAFFV